ncbi:MAG TPA: OmpA family protein [Candidatus Polarisedimenticolaceae bacterium]|nr:OmpA family protein [Candidatus Polarisedimenticolaceae bacterium]
MRVRGFVLVFAMLALLTGGCAKKHSRTTMSPEAAPPPAPVSAPLEPSVAPPPPPAVRDPLDGDLTTVNRYLREQGLLDDLLFDYNRHELTPDARRQLEAVARFLKERPQFQVALEGHADERGTVEYNVALGQKRAVSARSHLDTMGVSSDRLRASSYGEERPLCKEPSESCWKRNRRVHFEVVGRVE